MGGKSSTFIIDETAHWNFENIYRLTAKEILEKFSNYLSEEQIEELKKYE